MTREPSSPFFKKEFVGVGGNMFYFLKGQGITSDRRGDVWQDPGGLSLVLRSFQGIFGPPSLPCFAFVCVGFFQIIRES